MRSPLKKKIEEESIEDIISFRDFFRIFMKVMYALRKIIVGLVTFIIAVGLLIGHIEGIGYGNGVYLAFVSALTVGYGDITPTTTLSRILCVGVLPVAGMLMTGIMVAGAIKAIEIGNLEMKEKKETLEKSR